MRTRHLLRVAPLLAVLLALTAAPARAAELFTVDNANQLRRVDVAAPASGTPMAITGLQTGESIVGIDLRPMNNVLYGIGNVGGVARLYTINTTTGAAAQVGNQFGLIGTFFGVDFNPVPDRLRVVSDADQNLRLNPEDASVTTDANLHYATGDPNEAANPNVVASAYTNNFLGATSSTRYGIDSALNALVLKTPPNDGVLTTVGPLGVDFSATSGFDIVDDGTAYATTAGTSSSALYRVNTATGAATLAGTMPYVVNGLTGIPTGAAGPFSGMLNRGPAADEIDFVARNDGQRAIQFLALQLLSGYTPMSGTRVSGPDIDCMPVPNFALSCAFFGPDYWAATQELLLRVRTNPRYPDNAGARLFVCARPCAPFFRDAGPFDFGGPAPAGTTPPPGGEQPPTVITTWGDGAWNRDAMLQQLLPYMEQRPALQAGGDNWSPQAGGTPSIVKTYGCPSRPQSQSDPSGWDLGPGDPSPWNTSWGGTGNSPVNVQFGDGSVRAVTPECNWRTFYNALGTQRRGGPIAFGSRASGRRPRVRRLRLGTARVSVPAGETRIVATRLSRRARRTLRKQRVRRLRVEVRYTVTSPVGDRITAKRTFRVKLRRRARRGG